MSSTDDIIVTVDEDDDCKDIGQNAASAFAAAMSSKLKPPNIQVPNTIPIEDLPPLLPATVRSTDVVPSIITSVSASTPSSPPSIIIPSYNQSQPLTEPQSFFSRLGAFLTSWCCWSPCYCYCFKSRNHEDSNEAILLRKLSNSKQKVKKTLVLDLDETLVHSSFKPVPNPDYIIPVEVDSNVHRVYVLKRPGLDEFLKGINEMFEVVIFTASLCKYADPLLDQLDTTDSVSARLFRQSCIFHAGNYVKDLSRLGRDLRHVIIVDNSPHSYAFHPENAIPVDSWFKDPLDTQLPKLLNFLLSLDDVEDVRQLFSGRKSWPHME